MRYGLIGEKLSHSFSPKIHALFGNSDYELKEIPKDDLSQFMQSADFKGINVTIPYKGSVMPHCVLSEDAQRIGAVNTIVNNNGTLYGYNTDYMGFLYCAKRANIPLNVNKAVILGSGGTSKTVSAALCNAKQIVKVSRFGADNYDNLHKHSDADIIINTTPVGMYPNLEDCPLDLDVFTSLKGVIDVIYNPLRTRLLLECKRRKIPYANGLPMLVAQAAYAHELFFDTSVEDLLESAVAKAETMFRNIVFIGMPGSGKSTVAARLGKKLFMEVVDTDKEVKKLSGKTPSEIIKAEGEAKFREIEAEAVKNASKRNGVIIATGGGAILRSENRGLLSQNGVIFYLNRDINKLATKNRPLSQDLEKLYSVRHPIYESMADYKIDVHESIARTISDIEVNL